VDYDNGTARMAAAAAATHVNRTVIENGDIVLRN
jgi:hypothetical protein